MIWTSEKLSKAVGVEIPKGIEAGEVQFNSNDIKPKDLFIALKGKIGDGHSYVKDALNKGAALAIVNTSYTDEDKRIVQVNDTMNALMLLAEHKRKHSKAKFIAVTGSVGKTSTKEIIKLVLEPFGNVFASRGNFNNYLGVPINLASIPDDLDFVVMELGMNHAGEIRPLSKLIKPDIAIITNIAETHIEFFESIDGIADAKCEIFEGLNSNSIAIINKDTKCFERIVDNLRKQQINKIYAFSSDKQSDCKLESYESKGSNVDLTYRIKSKTIKLTLQNLPKHQAKNIAIGLLIADVLGLDLNKAKNQLDLFKLTKGRGQIISVTKGKKKYQLICDYYNASPESLKASLEYLKQIDHSKKVVIIGDMRELGKYSKDLHESIVPYIVDAKITKVLLVGENVKYIEQLLPDEILVKRFLDADELLENLEKLLGEDELILIKGSLGVNLKRTLEYFDKK